ncbi:STAS domain-containing protein [Luedemannella helvata]|uniref:Anti-sigma factor antagonist n=1 Tax=Luedemannella helvata TaxID=349315 RepID=A0ABP4WP11_9ACTN
MSLTIGVDERDNVAVVSVDGELDLATAPELAAAIDGQVAEGRVYVVLDLTALSFCDSAGLRVFVRYRRQLEEAGGRFVVAAPSPMVRRVLEISGLAEMFGSYATVDEAVEAVSSGPLPAES